MPSDAARRVALARYQQQTGLYRTRAAAALTLAWDRLGSYDESSVPRFAAQVGPTLAGAKVAAVAASVAFLTVVLGIRTPSIAARSVDVTPDLRQPFAAAWHALKVGRPFEEAVQVGRSVSEAVGFDFVQSTARRTGDLVAEATGRTVRWQRAPDADACAWCLSVAPGSYLTAESADFGHERCGCDVVPA